MSESSYCTLIMKRQDYHKFMESIKGVFGGREEASGDVLFFTPNRDHHVVLVNEMCSPDDFINWANTLPRDSRFPYYLQWGACYGMWNAGAHIAHEHKFSTVELDDLNGEVVVHMFSTWKSELKIDKSDVRKARLFNKLVRQFVEYCKL